MIFKYARTHMEEEKMTKQMTVKSSVVDERNVCAIECKLLRLRRAVLHRRENTQPANGDSNKIEQIDFPIVHLPAMHQDTSTRTFHRFRWARCVARTRPFPVNNILFIIYRRSFDILLVRGFPWVNASETNTK